MEVFRVDTNRFGHRAPGRAELRTHGRCQCYAARLEPRRPPPRESGLDKAHQSHLTGQRRACGCVDKYPRPRARGPNTANSPTLNRGVAARPITARHRRPTIPNTPHIRRSPPAPPGRSNIATRNQTPEIPTSLTRGFCISLPDAHRGPGRPIRRSRSAWASRPRRCGTG